MANSTILYACTGDGLAIANKPGTLPEWLPPRMVLRGQRVSGVWAEAGPPTRVLVVAGGGLLSSENGGRTWEPVALPLEVAVVSLAEAGDPPTLYAGLANGQVSVSTDGGRTWATPLPVSPEQLVELAVSPTVAIDRATARLYSATERGVETSGDGGHTWTLLPGSPAAGVCLEAIPGPAGKPPALLVGSPSGLFVSPDGGSAWHAGELPGPEPSMGVTALARDPERRDRVYAAAGEGLLFESGNRGQTWERINAQPTGRVSSLFIVRI